MNYFCLLLNCLIIAILFSFATGCRTICYLITYPPDPSDVSATSISRAIPWEPPLEIEITAFPDPCNEHECALPDEDKPLSVEELLDIGLFNNPATKGAWANARAAAFLVGEAKSALYPNVQWQGSLVLTDQLLNRAVDAAFGPNATTSANVFPNYFTSLQKDLMISYLVLDFGGRQASIDSARFGLFSSNWIHNRTIQDVMVTILQDYYNYIYAKDLVIARIEDLRIAQGTLDVAQASYNAGVKTILDFLQAKTNFINYQLLLETAKGQEHINLGIFTNSLGLPPETKFTVKDLPEKLPTEEVSKNVNDYIEIARANRPDLASAYALVKQSEANLIVAKSLALPNITANANLQNTFYFTEGLNSSYINTASLSLNVPLFDGFLSKNRIRFAKEQIDIAIANLEATDLLVALDVITSFWTFKTAAESIVYSEEYLKYALEAYKAAFATYQFGTGSILDVLTAQTSLSNAREQLLLARTQWLIALANIAYSTGSLDIPEDTREIDEALRNCGCDPAPYVSDFIEVIPLTLDAISDEPTK